MKMITERQTKGTPTWWMSATVRSCMSFDDGDRGVERLTQQDRMRWVELVIGCDVTA